MFSAVTKAAALLAGVTGCLAQTTSSPSSTGTPTATTTTATFTTYTGTAESPVVSIYHYGSIQGNRSEYIDSVYNFKGIPFANSSKENRWHHPAHISAWYDLRERTTFGPSCPQQNADYYDEDCLTLNVWTPEGATFNDVTLDGISMVPTANASAYPVYVWIYGGRFAGGSTSDARYDGSGLAAKGVVVVSMNYRLGALGFLAHPELSANSTSGTSGNYGLVDQQAALHWTNENIASFGGDPTRITIGGQSAGAGSVVDHLYSPLGDDLFEQVIAESGVRYPHDPLTGSLAPSYRQLAEAEQQGVDFLTNTLNVSTIEEARELDVTAFLSSGELADTVFVGTVFENNTAYVEPPLFRPVLDGYVLPSTYDVALKTGNHTANAHILTGNNKDESGASTAPGYTVASYTAANEEVFGSVGLADEFFQLWAAGNTSDSAGNASNAYFQEQSKIGTYLWANEYTAGCELASNCSVVCYIYIPFFSPVFRLCLTPPPHPHP